MKNLLILVFALIVSAPIFGQQDPMFTKYMFNSLIYNPGYAGSNDHLSIALLHRTQWINFEGAPNTQSLTAHTPLREKRVGVGLNVIRDQIGVSNTTSVNLSYAYRIPFGKKAKLAIGVQGGMANWRADWDKLNLENGSDEAFMDNNPNEWLPNFGVGLYFSTKKFYAGLGAPKLIEHDLREKSSVEGTLIAQQYRHYYFSVGGAIPVKGDDIIFKPSLLVKNVGIDSKLRKNDLAATINAPTEFDLDVSFLFMETLWVGGAFRSSIEKFTNNTSSFDSGDIWAAYNLRNGLRIGAAYDFTLTEIKEATPGSFEVMLGYEFDFVTRQVETPRYF